MSLDRVTTYFEKVRDLVARAAPEMGGVRVNFVCEEIDEARREGNERYYMHVGHFPDTICVHPDAAFLPARNLVGLFLHEFGHLLAGDGEGEANVAVERAVGIPVFYDKTMLQTIKGM